MATTLLIARHGNTFSAGEVVRRVGTTDLPLSSSGLDQGLLLGAYLKCQALVPDIIFTSTLQRTIQTAKQAQQAMGTSLPVETLSIFNEIDYGPDENQPEAAVIARIGNNALNAWETRAVVPIGWNVHPQELIENWLNFASFLRTKHANKTILVITSNGIARFAPYLTGDFTKFSAQFTIKIATGAICILEHHDASAQWDCKGWNIRPT